jgi:hypothetical protein
VSNLARLTNDFASHDCSPEAAKAMQVLREEFLELAVLVDKLVPAGREQAVVLTKLEEAMFWANAGIARKHPVVDPEMKF